MSSAPGVIRPAAVVAPVRLVEDLEQPECRSPLYQCLLFQSRSLARLKLITLGTR